MDLDLVEVAAEANPPVCRIMDYNRFKYEAAQRAKESRRKATSTGIKEMKYRPKIGVGDFDTKTRQVARFLGEGHKVKITIMFRGREMSHPELGKRILDQVAETVAGRRQGGGGAQARRPQHDHGAGARPPGPGPQAVSPTAPAATGRPTSGRPTATGAGASPSRRRPVQPESAAGPATGGDPPASPRWPPPAAAAPMVSGASSNDHRGPDPTRLRRTRGVQNDAEDEDRPGRRQALQDHGSGKLRRRQAFRSHLLEKKSTTRTRRLGREVDVAPADVKAVKRLLGI